MKLFVLAAGYATRLYPLTRDRPKALLDIGGLPLLSRLLARFLDLDGLSEIVIVSNHRFAESFEAWRRDFASKVPLRILDDGTREESTRLGASGDLAFALRAVPLAGEDFAVVAGDNLLEFDLAPLVAEFRKLRCPMLVLRRVEPMTGPSPYNEVRLDASGDVVALREKPTDPQSDLAAVALYFFPSEVAKRLDEYLAAGGECDAPGHFIEWLVSRERVAGRRFEGEGRWFDIGNLAALEQARAHFSEPSPHVGDSNH